MLKRATITAFVLATAALISLRPWLRVRAQSTRVQGPPAVTLLIRYGVTDKVEKTWRGRLEPDSPDARVLSLAGYHFQQGDRVTGQEWEFKTRLWEPPNRQVDLSPGLPGPRTIFPNGIYALVAGAKFRLETGAGPLPVALADLTARRMLSFAEGNIEVEIVPAPVKLSGADGEADFPALAIAGPGRTAVVWQEFVRDHDRIAVWNDGPPQMLERPETRDVFRPAVAWDGAGTLHVIWSAQVNGNWDLYEARNDGNGFGPAERLTQAPESDFNQKVIADQQGNLWLAWQGFRQGQTDIFAKRYAQGKWGPEIKLSESAANDWEPALV